MKNFNCDLVFGNSKRVAFSVNGKRVLAPENLFTISNSWDLRIAKDRINVGCQGFSISQAKALSKALNNANLGGFEDAKLFTKGGVYCNTQITREDENYYISSKGKRFSKDMYILRKNNTYFNFRDRIRLTAGRIFVNRYDTRMTLSEFTDYVNAAIKIYNFLYN